MSVTRKELHIRALSRIDERYGSTVGALYNANDSGNALQVDGSWNVVTSSGTTLTTDQEMDFYLNLAASEWCRTAFYLPGTATLTWPTSTASKRLNELTPAASQGNLHSVETAYKTISAVKTRLQKFSRGALRNHYPDYAYAAVTPANLLYYATDQSTIHLQGVPSSTVDLTFHGPCYPEDLSGSVTSWSWMEDNELKTVIPTLTALYLIRRKFSDENLFGRFEELAAQYNDLYMSYRLKLDKATLAEHFKEMDSELRGKK